MPRVLITLVFIIAAFAAACTGGGATPPPSGAPSPSPGQPTASPTPGSPEPEVVVVTIAVLDETYRILLTDPADIEIARTLLAGGEAPSIPNGKVVHGEAGVNTGYSWHIDPDDVEWADMTIELCDGKPSDVEADAISGDRFCPWSAKVVAVDAVPA